jgi:uncharacterized protein (TIGR03579 family)
MENKQKLNSFLLKNSSFPILLALLCAGVWGGMHMYYVNGTGLFTDVIVGQMFLNAGDTGGYMSLGLFGLGYLFARILEGPLVGILDIGGSVMTGVGVGIPAILMAFGITAPIENFVLALITGAVIGLLVGLLIMLMKNTMAKGVTTSGTNIMMGAGNALGVYLAPLLILAAVDYSIGAGLGALAGALAFYLLDKNIVGGVIIGAMIVGVFF